MSFSLNFSVCLYAHDGAKNRWPLKILTRKRDKAQRVVRPACKNATMHFLLTYSLAMLLSPSEWL